MQTKGRHRATLIGLAWLGMGLLQACTSSQGGRAEVATGARAEVTEDGLHRLTRAGFKNAWAKPSANFPSYDKLGLELVKIRYKRAPMGSRSNFSSGNRSNFALSQRQIKDMQRHFRQIFQEELEQSSSFELATAPGPDVLYVEASIIDLVIKVPTDLPTGRERVMTTSTGNMTLMLEVYDSESGEILARVTDRSEARHPGRAGPNDLYWSNPVTNTDAVLRVFRRWASILRDRLDRIHRVEAEPDPAS